MDRSKWLYTKAAPNGNKHISYILRDQERIITRVERNSPGSPYILPPNHLKLKILIAFPSINSVFYSDSCSKMWTVTLWMRKLIMFSCMQTSHSLNTADKQFCWKWRAKKNGMDLQSVNLRLSPWERCFLFILVLLLLLLPNDCFVFVSFVCRIVSLWRTW